MHGPKEKNLKGKLRCVLGDDINFNQGGLEENHKISKQKFRCGGGIRLQYISSSMAPLRNLVFRLVSL